MIRLFAAFAVAVSLVALSGCDKTKESSAQCSSSYGKRSQRECSECCRLDLSSRENIEGGYGTLQHGWCECAY